MIKRTYFVSAKVAHNNGTGNYSYYNGAMNFKSWLPMNADEMVSMTREEMKCILDCYVDRDLTPNDIELIAFNKA